jgi:hypothetical protein
MVGEEVAAAFVVVVAVVEQGHDRAGVDDDHASVGPSRRMSSERSARSCSAERVPALANRRGAVGTGPWRLARRICSKAGSRVSGTASSSRCTSSRLVIGRVCHGAAPVRECWLDESVRGEEEFDQRDELVTRPDLSPSQALIGRWCRAALAEAQRRGGPVGPDAGGDTAPMRDRLPSVDSWARA